MKSSIILLILSSCSPWAYLSTPDNAVEEIAEAILEHETGLSLDFSPSTPENR